jgi:geranylgeranyl reductase family protein
VTVTCADVLVVGLGPAGASAARTAARAGLNVIALDRKRRAGEPVQCAEFVPQLLSPTIEAVAATGCQRIDAMQTFVEHDAPDWQGNFPGVMVDRAAFDAHLVDAARAAGAGCHFGRAVATIDPDGIVHSDDGRTFRATVLVGADGPRSRVGRVLGQVNHELVAARQVTVPLLQVHGATDIFLSAGYPGGYAWLFPRGDVANLGIGVSAAARECLKPALERLRAELIGEGRIGDSIISATGGTIPVGGMLKPHGRIGNCAALLCGDAAGLTNPVTGAGISAAVLSGIAAGEAAAALCASDGDACEEYAEDLEDLFGAAIARAVKRRRAVLAQYQGGNAPSADTLRGGWIAYPEYWAA